MAIAIQCPHCSKSYRLKDDLAGKRVTCTDCRKTFPVPAPVTAPSKSAAADVEALVAAVLNEEGPKAAAVQTESAELPPIVVRCQHCDHENKFEASYAGKNRPCGNDDCRKILKVPLPKKEDPKDWRTVKSKPTLARVDTDNIDGAWGNVQTTAVSREALKGADAIGGPIEEEPKSWTRRIVRGAAVLGVLGLILAGVLWGLRKRSAGQREDSMNLALNYVEVSASPKDKKAKTEKLKKEPAALIYWMAARHDAKARKPADAFGKLKTARNWVEGNGAEQQYLRTTFATSMVELAGTKLEVEQGTHVDATKVMGEVKQTLSRLASVGGEDGRDLRAQAIRSVTRACIQRDMAMHAAVLAKTFESTGEWTELAAIVGLELLAHGKRDEAEKLAADISGVGVEATPSLIALWLAIGGPEASDEKKKSSQDRLRLIVKAAGDSNPSISRIGYAEGYARQGDLDKARQIAWAAGRAEDRLRAGSAVANVVVAARAGDLKDIEACAKLIETDFRDRKPAPWLVFNLVRLALKAERADLAQTFANNISDPGLKTWAQYHVLRHRLATAEQKKELGDTEWTKEIGDPARLAYSVGWAAVARQRARISSAAAVEREIVKFWDKELLRPFGYAGIALVEIEDAP